jgi:hypothetical protein
MFVEKVAHQCGLLLYVIFKKLPKMYVNNHPMGEHSPNLVTLIVASATTRDARWFLFKAKITIWVQFGEP